MGALFPQDPGPENYLAWLLVVLVFLGWMLFLRKEFGRNVLPITSQQEIGEELSPVDVLNQRRINQGKKPLDRELFQRYYEEELARLEKEAKERSIWRRLGRRLGLGKYSPSGGAEGTRGQVESAPGAELPRRTQARADASVSDAAGEDVYKGPKPGASAAAK